MFNHPRMTSSGRLWALLFGLLLIGALPKRVECGYAGADPCALAGTFHRKCSSYEVEPLGFYLIERVAHADVGFAYSTGETCR